MKKLSILFAAVLMATMSFAGTKTVVLDGSATGVSSTATSKESTISQNGFSYTMSKGGKLQVSNGENKFEGTTNCILIGKSGAYIYNNTPFDEKITKFELYSNKAASAKVSVSVSFSTTPISAATTNTDSLWTATLSTVDSIYDVAVPAGAKYFYYKVTNNNNSQVAFRITYEEPEGAISTPTFTPTDADFADTTTVTLAAEEGLDIYYTLDGTEPTVTTGTKYAAAISLNKTTTIKAIAYNATTQKSSAVVEKTYTCYSLITTCAGLADAAKNDFVELGKVTVIYVNGANTYICDNTGYGLLYKYNYGLKAGQVAEGIKGRVTIYSGLPEIEPSVDTAALTITEGTVPEPIELATVPTAADLNKYVHITGVVTPDTTWKSSDGTAARTLKVAWGKDSLTLYNTFKIDQTFDAGCYHIVGFVTCYNTTIQIAVVSATAAVYSVVADVNNDDMGTIEGLPAEKIAYGMEITLTAKPNTGYKFINWTDTTGIVVSTEAAYTFMVTSDVDIQANFEVKTFKVDADINDEKMGTVDGVPADEVAYGTKVTFTAIPEDGYKFVNWTDATGAEVSTEAEYTFTVTGEVTYTANFALNTAIDNTTATKTATKRIENGTLVIEKNGIRYNALGTVVE